MTPTVEPAGVSEAKRYVVSSYSAHMREVRDDDKYVKDEYVMAADYDALRQQLAEMRANDARYRWLRAGGDYTLACINPEAGAICGENLDAVIDGAMRNAR